MSTSSYSAAKRPKATARPAICRNGKRAPTAEISNAMAARRPPTNMTPQMKSTTGFISSRPAMSGKDTTFQVHLTDVLKAG